MGNYHCWKLASMIQSTGYTGICCCACIPGIPVSPALRQATVVVTNCWPFCHDGNIPVLSVVAVLQQSEMMDAVMITTCTHSLFVVQYCTLYVQSSTAAGVVQRSAVMGCSSLC